MRVAPATSGQKISHSDNPNVYATLLQLDVRHGSRNCHNACTTARNRSFLCSQTGLRNYTFSALEGPFLLKPVYPMNLGVAVKR